MLSVYAGDEAVELTREEGRGAAVADGRRRSTCACWRTCGGGWAIGLVSSQVVMTQRGGVRDLVVCGFCWVLLREEKKRGKRARCGPREKGRGAGLALSLSFDLIFFGKGYSN